MGIKVKVNGSWEDVAVSAASVDINGLTEETSIVDADEIMLYDASATANRKVGIDTLRELTPTPHDTGYVTCNDWTDQLLGDTVGGNVNHGFGLNLSDLDVRVLFSTDGTDANSFEMRPHVDVHGGVGNFGFTIDQVDTNNLSIQTGSGGIRYLDSAGGPQTFTNGWSYRVIVKRW